MKIVSKMIEAHVFREAQNGIEFLLMKRSDNQFYPGLWQMVTGKIIHGEQAFETALREMLLEPLGMDHSYFFPHEVMLHSFSVGHLSKLSDRPS